MKMKFSLWLLITILLISASSARAQQSANSPRIGFLIASSRSSTVARDEAFLQGLREAGYMDGRNIIIEWRAADGKPDRISALAAELVRLKVDVIVTSGPADTKAAKEATRTIPIVMTFDNDPVANGFVASLARPGGNITGLSTLAPELSGKRLELLKEIIPNLSRVGVLGNSNEPGYALGVKEIEAAAAAFKLQLHTLDVIEKNEIEPKLRAASKASVGAILQLGSPSLATQRKVITELMAKYRLPAIYYSGNYVEDGGLMSYGVNRNDLARRAATYVDKILKGRAPADLPVEQPIKFEFIVNLKAAKQIGLTIPPNVLARADRVIK